MRYLSTVIAKKISIAVFLSSLLMFFTLPIRAEAAANVSKRFSSIYAGRIIVDSKSREAWYVNPVDLSRVYLGEPEEALSILLSLSLGISNKDFKKIPLETEKKVKKVENRKLLNLVAGRVLVKVQDKRKAYYVNPITRKAVSLATSDDVERLITSGANLGKRMLERIALSEYNPLLDEGSDNDSDEDGLSDFDEIVSGTSPFRSEPEQLGRAKPLAQDTSRAAPYLTPTSTAPFYQTPSPAATPSTTTSTTTVPVVPDLVATLPYLITGATNRLVTLAGAVMPLSTSVYIKLYEWDFTTDGVYDYVSSWQGTVDYLYPSTGEYTATFRVTDNLGRQSKASMKVQISAPGAVYVPPISSTTTSTTTPSTGTGPVASLVASISGTTDRVVTLSGAVSYLSPGTSVIRYEWDYTSDGNYDYISPTQSSVDHLYATPATYTATFRVTDSLNRQSSASMKVYITSPVTSTTTATTTTPIIPPPPQPTITVTSPNGGEELVQGGTYGINWTSTGDIQNVQIFLLRNGSQDAVLATVANTGAWTWVIPTGLTYSSGAVYQIKVSNLANQDVYDNSNASFSIAPLPITGTDTSLIGHWKFDGNGNNEIAGGPSAVIVGSANFNADGGRLSGYAYIPSANDSVKIPYNSAFDLPNAFTIEFWFRQRSDRGFFQDLVYKGTPINNYNFRVFRQLWNQYNFGPIITGYTSITTGWWTQTSNPNQLTHGAWHHVAFVKDSTWRAYYLDGVLIHSETDSPMAKTPANDIIIGDSAVDTDIDDLKIFNRALRGSEIIYDSSR